MRLSVVLGFALKPQAMESGYRSGWLLIAVATIAATAAIAAATATAATTTAATFLPRLGFVDG